MKPWLFLLAGVVACENTSAGVDPVWGKQACASCAMVVSERKYAAELVTVDGARMFFDDVGCMATWLFEHPDKARRTWVRTNAGAWVDARTARFVAHQPSPMNFGFAPDDQGAAAWADVEAAARARAAKGDR